MRCNGVSFNKVKSPNTSTLPNHRAPDLFIPSKITRAAYSASKMTREASFPIEAHEEITSRSEDLLWADVDDLQVNLSVGMEFGKRFQNQHLISVNF